MPAAPSPRRPRWCSGTCPPRSSMVSPPRGSSCCGSRDVLARWPAPSPRTCWRSPTSDATSGTVGQSPTAVASEPPGCAWTTAASAGPSAPLSGTGRSPRVRPFRPPPVPRTAARPGPSTSCCRAETRTAPPHPVPAQGHRSNHAHAQRLHLPPPLYLLGITFLGGVSPRSPLHRAIPRPRCRGKTGPYAAWSRRLRLSASS